MAKTSENLNYTVSQQAVWRKIMEVLTRKRHGATSRGGGQGSVKPRLCQKAGAPATDTAGDTAITVYDMCWDSTNGDVYISTLATSDTASTWVKISD